MPYHKVLRDLIFDSGYTSKYIVEECNKLGVKIDKSYMSKLVNNKLPAPSEEVSRAISKVCNVDERKLVLEGYIDKAPEEIREFLIILRTMFSKLCLNFFENNFEESLVEEVEKNIRMQPLSDFAITILDNQKDISKEAGETFSGLFDSKTLKINTDSLIGIPVKDSSMLSIVPNGSKVLLTMQGQYNNGEIVAVKVKETEEVIVRIVMFQNDTVFLTSLNKEYKTQIYDKQDVVILGRVSKVVNEI